MCMRWFRGLRICRAFVCLFGGERLTPFGDLLTLGRITLSWFCLLQLLLPRQ